MDNYEELRARVEALEAQASNLKGSLTSSTPPPVATDQELQVVWSTAPTVGHARRALFDLGIEYGQASSREVADPAPVAGGLVERVTSAAIHEVETGLRERGWEGVADVIEQEAGR